MADSPFVVFRLILMPSLDSVPTLLIRAIPGDAEARLLSPSERDRLMLDTQQENKQT